MKINTYVLIPLAVVALVFFTSVVLPDIGKSIKSQQPKNGIVTNVSTEISDSSGFKERKIYVHKDEDKCPDTVYVFYFKPDESPLVTVGQRLLFSVKSPNEYLQIDDETFFPYIVGKLQY